MNKLILTFLLLSVVSINSTAQTNPDSTIYRIEMNLDKMHKQYRTGTVFTTIGLALAVAGAASIAQDNDQPGLLYAGGAILTIGGIIHIDSHKFLNKKRK